MKNMQRTGLLAAVGFLLLIASGLVLTGSLNAETVTYKYDANGRLLDVDYGGKNSHAYTFDKAGNILTETVAARVRHLLEVSVEPVGSGSVTGGTIDCPSACSALIAEGKVVTLTAEPEREFEFLGWGGACTGTGTCQVTMDEPRQVTATFQQVTYTSTDVPRAIPDRYHGAVNSPLMIPPGVCTNITDVDVNVEIEHPSMGDIYISLSNPDGSRSIGLYNRSCGSDANMNAVFDDEAAGVIECPPNGIYQPAMPLSGFDGPDATGTWYLYVSDNREGETGTLVSWGITLHCATGPVTHQLTVNKTGTGGGGVTPDTGTLTWTGNTGIGTYDHNAPVVLTANAAAGSTFTGWSGEGCSGTGTCTVAMSAARSVTAAFTLRPPTITSLAPTSGAVGTEVTIAGARFGASRGSSVVAFNGVSVTDYTSWSATQIKCKVPAGAATGPVKVTTAAGVSKGVAFTVVPAPAIASLSPTSGPVGALVTIKGANFGSSQGSSMVKFKGVSAIQYASWSDTRIRCKVPAGAATGQVTVTTGGGTSNGVAFTVIPAPAIASLSPASGPVGTLVTINGSNFGASQGSSVVKFKGVPAIQYTSWSRTRIKCKVPAEAATGEVTVTTAAGTSNGVAFTVTSAPTITSLSPTTGPVGAVVTIKGKKFGSSRGSSAVEFKGVPATRYLSWSESRIRCKVPAGAANGPVTVVTGGGTSNGIAFKVTAGSSVIGSAGPDQRVAGGAQVKLSGANSIGAADGSVVSFKWAQIAGLRVELADAQSLETWFTAPLVGPAGESLVFELTFTAVDGSESRDTCIVNVSEVNNPPLAQAGPNQQVVDSEIVTLNGLLSEDPDDECLGYAWTQIEGSPVVLSDPTSPQPVFVAPGVGSEGESLVFELTVTDAGGLRSRDRCVVNVTWENNPPQAAAGLMSKVKPGTRADLDGSDSLDNDDGIASFRWTQTAGSPVKLSDPTAIRPTLTAPETGADAEVLVFELTVTDRTGLKQKAKATVMVKGSLP